MLNKITRFFNGFDPSVREGVRQALEYFGCCSHILGPLNRLEEERLEEARIAAEERGRKRVIRKKTADEAAPRGCKKSVAELPKLTIVVGLCPRCGELVRGEPVRECASRGNGRHFYKECSSCSYYAEIFKVRHKFKEVEGG